MKQFHNKPNERWLIDHAEVWISRSVAVVGVVIVIDGNDNKHFLVTTRSEKMNHGGKRCLPCGYLDWDETTYEAMVREVYEETSLYIPDYENLVMFDNNKLPFKIVDNPKDDVLQNVSFTFVTVLFKNELPILTITSDEVSKVEWMDEDMFHKTYNEPWAFGHNIRILSAINYCENRVPQFLQFRNYEIRNEHI